ncbi:MAG: DUF4365 domain-containing protein [Acidobacteriia bacterium]|nr:DUF4365 domain-containing protein [Terriglobia bacterium]
MIERYDWARLNHLQIGRYAEYFVKMELTLHGFEVYTAEVDDRGVDLVMRKTGHSFYEVQVKSVRGLNYIFFRKSKFQLRPSLMAAVVLFQQLKPPALFLIESERRLHLDPLFVSRDYEDNESEPEWGLNLSEKNRPLLETFRFDQTKGVRLRHSTIERPWHKEQSHPFNLIRFWIVAA